MHIAQFVSAPVPPRFGDEHKIDELRMMQSCISSIAKDVQQTKFNQKTFRIKM